MTRAYIVAVALTGLVGGACSDDASMGPDAGTGDAAIDSDGRLPGTAGIRLLFDSDPDIPGEGGGEWSVQIGSVDFQLQDVRVDGDAVSPGDPQPTVSSVRLRWQDEEDKEPVDYPGAPPGLYSLVLARVQSYELEGTVVVGGETEEFDIEDDGGFDIAISLGSGGVQVIAGERKDIDIVVHLGALVNAVNWDNVEEEDGALTVDEDSAELESLRNALLDQFDPIFDAGG